MGEYPGPVHGQLRARHGATWLEVKKAEGGTDHRPVVSEVNGPDWGYHPFDDNLALGNLVTDVGAAESTWSRGSNSG